MPNGIDEEEDLGLLDEEQDLLDEQEALGQADQETMPDLTAPMITAPITPPSPTVPVNIPGVSPILPPTLPPPAYKSPFLTDEEAAMREQMRRTEYAIRDMPLEQAEKALGAAMKFQAIRGYQRDLSSGVSAADALSKWAPMMFAQSKAGSLGSAASFIRATRAPAPMIRGFGGVGYKIEGGKAIPITPQPYRNLDTNDPTVLEYKSVLAQIARKQEDMNKNAGIADPETERQDFAQLQMLQHSADALAARIRAKQGRVPAAAGVAPAGIAGPSGVTAAPVVAPPAAPVVPRRTPVAPAPVAPPPISALAEPPIPSGILAPGAVPTAAQESGGLPLSALIPSTAVSAATRILAPSMPSLGVPAPSMEPAPPPSPEPEPFRPLRAPPVSDEEAMFALRQGAAARQAAAALPQSAPAPTPAAAPAAPAATPQFGEVQDMGPAGKRVWDGSKWDVGPDRPEAGMSRRFGGVQTVFTGSRWQPYTPVVKSSETVPVPGGGWAKAGDFQDAKGVRKVSVSPKNVISYDPRFEVAPVNPDQRIVGKVYWTDHGLLVWNGRGWDQPSYAVAPENVKARRYGQTYVTPAGLMKWAGTGWVKAANL